MTHTGYFKLKETTVNIAKVTEYCKNVVTLLLAAKAPASVDTLAGCINVAVRMFRKHDFVTREEWLDLCGWLWDMHGWGHALPYDDEEAKDFN